MNRNQQDRLDQNPHPQCLSLDALAGSGVTEEEGTIETSSPDEAVRSGGVMEFLIHGTGPFPGCCCGLLNPHCSHQSADISDQSSHFNNTVSFDFCIRSNKIILLYIFVK